MNFCSAPAEWPQEFWYALAFVAGFAAWRLSWRKKASKADRNQTPSRLIRRSTSWFEQEQ